MRQSVRGILHAVTSAAAGLQTRMDLVLSRLHLEQSGHPDTDETQVDPTLPLISPRRPFCLSFIRPRTQTGGQVFDCFLVYLKSFGFRADKPHSEGAP